MNETALRHDLDQVLAKHLILNAVPDVSIDRDFLRGLGNAVDAFRGLDRQHPLRRDPRYSQIPAFYQRLLEHSREEYRHSSDAPNHQPTGSSVRNTRKNWAVDFYIGMLDLSKMISSGKKIADITPQYLDDCTASIGMLALFVHDPRVQAGYLTISGRLEAAHRVILDEYARQNLGKQLERIAI